MDTMAGFDFGTMDFAAKGLEDGTYDMKVVDFKGYTSKAGKPWLKLTLAETTTGKTVTDYLPVPANSRWESDRWKLEAFYTAIGGTGIANFGTYDKEYGGFPEIRGMALTTILRNEVNDKGYPDLRVAKYGA